MQTIAVTGGKGGTGKTLISINLAAKLTADGYSVLLIDTDVENPNTNILLGKSLSDSSVQTSPVKIFTPIFDEEKCTKCGLCRKSCYRHAILQFPNQFPTVMDHMCSGCETCAKVCPTNAIYSKGREIGKKYFLPEVFPNLDLIVGELQPSEAVSVLIVEAILEYAEDFIKEKNYDIILIDTAPGAHCDVEKSLDAADQIIAVTEPTPFGLHDLKRILELLELNNHSASIILNRANIADFKTPLIDLIKKKNLVLLGEIPVDNKIIENYARGIPFVFDPQDFPGKESFILIYNKILEKIEQKVKKIND